MNVQSSTPTFTGKKYGYKQVDKYLFKGSAPTIKQLIELKEQGVNQIYDFRHTSTKGNKYIEVLMCKLLGINYKRREFNFFNIEGMPKLSDFEEIAASIRDNGKRGGKTLVHCNSGHHRTGQMVEFYNLTRGETLENCKKMYPKTYGKRVEIVLRDLIEKDNYFDRTYTSDLPLNPIARSIAKYNNKAYTATRTAFNEFKKLLLN